MISCKKGISFFEVKFSKEDSQVPSKDFLGNEKLLVRKSFFLLGSLSLPSKSRVGSF